MLDNTRQFFKTQALNKLTQKYIKFNTSANNYKINQKNLRV